MNSTEHALKGTGLILVSITNKSDIVFDHNCYNRAATDFDRGFYEAVDFFQYVTCHFSIASAHKIWPPQSEWDKEHAIEDGLLKYNHFWKKYEEERRSPSKFYNRLDIGNKKLLYMWYKTNVNKNNVNLEKNDDLTCSTDGR